jgi:CMP-N,N'-diacetyllegionaminic acid synthase
VTDQKTEAGGLTIVGIITARGGSKGIPGKNLIPIRGRPLISYTIEAALDSKVLDRIIVTTDDEKIAEVSRQFGAETPFVRPANLSGDWDPSYPVVVHALEWMAENEGYYPDYMMLMQPTSPMRIAEDIRNAVAIARDKDADGVISIYEPKQHPKWMFELDEDGRFADFDPHERELSRRQSLEPRYMLNGSIYLVKRAVIMSQDNFYTSQTYALVMPRERSIDIDSIHDARVVEMTMEDVANQGRADG